MTISGADEKPDLMALDNTSQRYPASRQRGRLVTVGSSSAGRP
jgi:hypothetical protein